MDEKLNDIKALKSDLIAENQELRQKLAESFKFMQKDHIAHEQLKEKEEFNFALFQYSPITMVVVDKSGRVIKSNQAKRKSGDRLPSIGDLMYKDYASRHSIDMHKELLDCIVSGSTKSFSEMKYADKYISITIAPFSSGAIISSQDITDKVLAERDRAALITDLRRALAEVETLWGLIPICSSCKNIRDDKGYWNSVEQYFSNCGKIDFSHTVCPTCMEKLYPDIWARIQEKKEKGSNCLSD